MNDTIIPTTIRRLLAWFGLHPDVYTLVRGSMRLSNPNSAAFPSENIPLASRVIASGMWNYCFFQFYRHFVGPYWVERQYNPNDPSFIPRATSMLSINLTHRTWCGFRAPGSKGHYFSMVDPAGALSPVIGYYSIEVALEVNGRLRLPTRGELTIEQRPDRVDDQVLPLPVTTFSTVGAAARLRSCGMEGDLLCSQIDYEADASDARLSLSIRPFNPEGAALIHSLRYEASSDGSGGTIYINGRPEILLAAAPDAVCFSTLADGDSYFSSEERHSVECRDGVATGRLIFDIHKSGRGEIPFYAHSYERESSTRQLPRSGPRHPPLPADEGCGLKATARLYRLRREWQNELSGSARFHSANQLWNEAAAIFSGYIATLYRGDQVTPGVFTYRQFWFRDAAYMLHALGSWNFLKESRAVLESYPARQGADGFFKSHAGEWDSNGQAIWSLTSYARMAGDDELLRRAWPAIRKGVAWIEKKRRKGPDGRIMPAGFSAEHLGPADLYYWDNIWSIHGLREAAWAARRLGDEITARRYHDFAELYSRDLLEISAADRERYGLIPAGPNRPVDSGMIGNIALLYPVLSPIFPKAEVKKSIHAIYNSYFHKGLFFHPIIHSGLNIYLSVQMAQALFRLNEVRKARRILKKVFEVRSALWTYPEAIHPLSGGGVMGDGFHGWAYAEILALLRDFTLYQKGETIHLFKGLRRKELFSNEGVTFGPFPIEGGHVTIRGKLHSKGGKLTIDLDGVRPEVVTRIKLHLPGLKKSPDSLLSLRSSGGQVSFRKGVVSIISFHERIDLAYEVGERQFAEMV